MSNFEIFCYLVSIVIVGNGITKIVEAILLLLWGIIEYLKERK